MVNLRPHGMPNMPGWVEWRREGDRGRSGDVLGKVVVDGDVLFSSPALKSRHLEYRMNDVVLVWADMEGERV